MDQPVYRVMVVEDETMILNNLVAKIESVSPGFRVTGTAYDGVEALEVIGRTRPHILFTDVQMPRMNGIELIRNVMRDYPDMLTAIISGHDQFEYAKQAIHYGVKEYLLKPVDLEAVQSTLARFRSILDHKSKASEKERLVSAIQGGRVNPDPHEQSPAAGFYLFLIQFGHLPDVILSPESAEYLAKLWQGIDWDEVAAEAAGTEGGYLIDQVPLYGNYLVIPAHTRLSSRNIAEALLRKLKDRISPAPVHISYTRDPAALRDLHMKSIALRAIMARKLIMGRSAVLGDDGSMNPEASFDEAEYTRKWTVLSESGNRELFRKELRKLLLQGMEQLLPQRKLQQMVFGWMHAALKAKKFVTEAEVSNLEYELQDKFVRLSEPQAISNEIVAALEYVCFPEEETQQGTSEALANDIALYLQDHYSSPQPLENMYAQFRYDPSYIAKLFKKYHHTTPLQYVISLRIREAKRLIAAEPELSFKEIGTLVGYPDPNYFSRIFKSSTGLSPSEYSIDIQGAKIPEKI